MRLPGANVRAACPVARTCRLAFLAGRGKDSRPIIWENNIP
ncbi:hypothetical protein DA2_2823 [Desulfovibrio sp. A2]|nr:hypothetical protein DA2_2823 [Desulfovibrio sp. A2]